MAQISVYAPIAYLGILLGSLILFSSVYRKRRVQRLAALEPWFGPSDAKAIHLAVKALARDRPVPDKVVKAALIRRAAENIRRIIVLQEAKPALLELHQKGTVGDEQWTRFTLAEKLMDAEIMECAQEANALKPGWAQLLFGSAAEIVQNERLRARIAACRPEPDASVSDTSTASTDSKKKKNKK
ncbi:translocation protein sec66 [Dipodascopsis tothii]|uniref:translocation protein sec66 n=1 Tax=Dipodascopsis tothii TaxID=44089 RepID=UPI0034CE2596